MDFYQKNQRWPTEDEIKKFRCFLPQSLIIIVQMDHSPINFFLASKDDVQSERNAQRGK